MGSRSNWGIVARSEAEFNEIVDNLNEQEVRGRKNGRTINPVNSQDLIVKSPL